MSDNIIDKSDTVLCSSLISVMMRLGLFANDYSFTAVEVYRRLLYYWEDKNVLR